MKVSKIMKAIFGEFETLKPEQIKKYRIGIEKDWRLWQLKADAQHKQK